MNEVFELATGSVQGREHRRLGRNNQDNFCVYQDRDLTVAVVADGCGSTPNSEVGAYIGSRMFVRALRQYLKLFDEREIVDLKREINFVLTDFVQGALGNMVEEMMFNQYSDDFEPDDETRLVAECLLFTLCGVVIVRGHAIFFAIGDGVFAINGEVIVIESENNAPSYLAYNILHDSTVPESKVQFVASLPSDKLESFVIGTDGVNDLIAASDKCLPGKSDTVGPLQQLWLEDRFYKNPDLLSRKLRLANTEVTRYNHELGQLEKHNGLLPDDTTLIVGRKKCPAQVAVTIVNQLL